MQKYILALLLCGTYGLSAQRINTIMSVKTNDDVHCHKVIEDKDLFAQGWDTLQQVMFWKEVVTLDPQHFIIYSLETREILGYAEAKEWNRMSATQRRAFQIERCKEYNVSTKNTIVAAQGRKDFYLFEETIPNIAKGISVFTAEKTDPWYAQAILLIESPGSKVKTSYSGARGSFQLMPEVAREMGLTVTEEKDDRTDFKKSAQGAARLMRQTCIPQTKAMLNKRGIAFKETDLWFRLLVMHSYHAGGGNVAAALNVINPKSGGMWLIQRLWKTNAAGFQNESQNYSQIALSAILQLANIVAQQGDIVCEITEEAW